MIRHWWARLALGQIPVSDPLQAGERPDARFEAEWRTLVKGRVLVLLAGLVLWAAGIEAVLIFVQVFSNSRYAALAKAQHVDRITIEAPRGDIVDRNGALLARSIQSFDLTADPSLVKDAQGDARELCDALRDCTADELAGIAATLAKGKPAGRNRSLKWALIRHAAEMSPDNVIGVQALIDGRVNARPRRPAVFTLTPNGGTRWYPKMDLASQVIGFISPDGKSRAGIELRRNAELSGVPGKMSVLLDGNQNEMLTRVESPPQPGASIELTIDQVLQHIAQRYLAEGITASGGSAGAAIVLDTRSGQILADASWPDYNPNAYGRASDDERRNRTVQDTFEPGSTMKILTAAAGLNDGVLTPDTLIDCNPGTFTVPGTTRVITEAKRHNYGSLSFGDVVVKSSNVGAAKAGLFQIGGERLLRYAERFGLGSKSTSDFEGERSGVIPRSAASNNSALASMAIGYQIAVTPLQLAALVNAVANGGRYVQPYVVRAIIRDGRREETRPSDPRPVISPNTAATLTAILEDVVARGTGAPAALQRYRAAGKTGTAAKAQKGGYSTRDYMVSFVGFVPSRDPRFTILVVVDSPHNVDPYGGTVAGPIFKKIAEAALLHEGVPPSINPVPPIVVADDRSLLAPPARAVIAVPARLDLGGDSAVMPDLRGLTLREAVRRATALGLQISPIGDGIVVSQSPAPGDPIASVDRGVLQARRDPVGSGGGAR
jgi:cell division protein FtsI/penicillin-binding protein 2